ncbi:glucosaminidase domain-containing protein [Mangrovimonas sp. AS39]|uniref:glucosaminidase domain-containing protein n=1 Tax=Mangrovimonas futianensis TaxID=2895523 RepID=UPI001E50EC88|nr:glucosaminidase domain-containing protein [Mangrovimonas futianensis]MCF1192545.1 glucosaminidase domain-containing protein [Mangrovimonas futianensis]MCF1196125.1 glucosaminidase domain-containing protein [Mangrovimonas futianensis]
MRKIVFLCLLSVLVFNCGSKKKAASVKTKKERVVRNQNTRSATSSTQPKTNNTAPTTTPNTTSSSSSPTVAYINLYHAVAMEEMKLYGIPASITLAQGILESGSGKGRLSVEANNHFGIKCHDWTGAKIYHDDDRSQECFRKYNDAKYSFRDHSLFLKERKRYYKLFELDPDDYRGWARELRAAGYATDRRYPEKLIDLIERYQLHQYDDQVLGNPASRNRIRTVTSTNVPASVDNFGNTYTVQKGDTLYSISKKHNLTVEQLRKMNGLKNNDLQIGQVLSVK